MRLRMRLEDLRPGQAVRGLLPDGPVTVVSVQWFGDRGRGRANRGRSGGRAGRRGADGTPPGADVSN